MVASPTDVIAQCFRKANEAKEIGMLRYSLGGYRWAATIAKGEKEAWQRFETEVNRRKRRTTKKIKRKTSVSNVLPLILLGDAATCGG